MIQSIFGGFVRAYRNFFPTASVPARHVSLGSEATVGYAARASSLDPLNALDSGVVERWAKTQATRLYPGANVLETIPWWYPVHPTVIGHFMEKGWWDHQQVRAHAMLSFYAMNSTKFGGEWGTFYRHSDYQELDTDTIIDWCVQFITRFDLPPELKAAFLGHTRSALGTDLWMERVFPACAGHTEDVEWDVLFAVSHASRPEGIALEMAAELDDGLRMAVSPTDMDPYASMNDPAPYALVESHPHFPLRYMLQQQKVWSDFMLYKVGVYLKRLESTEVESFALPDKIL